MGGVRVRGPAFLHSFPVNSTKLLGYYWAGQVSWLPDDPRLQVQKVQPGNSREVALLQGCSKVLGAGHVWGIPGVSRTSPAQGRGARYPLLTPQRGFFPSGNSPQRLGPFERQSGGHSLGRGPARPSGPEVSQRSA